MLMGCPKISVIVPVYNVASYLKECMESIVHQSFKDTEIICINDGSTDDSLDILKRYARCYSNIFIVDKTNSGYGHSVNIGLKRAKGEYVSIIESDDFIELDMLEKIYDVAVMHDADMVKTNYFSYCNGKDEFIERLEGCSYNTISNFQQQTKLILGHASIWSAVYRRGFLLENDIWMNETPGASFQDVAFYFKTLVSAKRIFLLPDAFVHYRLDNEKSSTKSSRKIYCVCDEFHELSRWINTRNNLYDEYKYWLEYYRYNIYLANFHRIASAYKYEFFLRSLEEFKQANHLQLLKGDIWRKQDWENIQEILRDSQGICSEVFGRIQKYCFLYCGLLNRLRATKAIYLYGAGKRANFVLRELSKKKINISGILVTDKKGNSSDLQGITVSQITEVTLPGNAIILIAVSEEKQGDIIAYLYALGEKNIVAMTSEIIKSLWY